jgi:hypothetical protein
MSSKVEELQKPGRQSAEVSATLTESEVEVKMGGQYQMFRDDLEPPFTLHWEFSVRSRKLKSLHAPSNLCNALLSNS